MNLEKLFTENKNENLFGRYIKLNDIEPILLSLNTNNQLSIIGKSVLVKPIYQYIIGKGSKKALLWSQMHGNESTTTKSLFDFLNLLHSNTDFANNLLENFTIYCIPMLNPDGAAVYTRENANLIDLNRDFQDFSQPESKLLMQVFNDFKPDYCYNLHDQRTIYGAGSKGKPATVSFLAPAFNENRDYNDNRREACRIINGMNAVLQAEIPNQIGRFDDGFNPNCAGDCFQSKGVPTILFEAGHFPNDYDREITRKHIFSALISSFDAILNNYENPNIIDDYLNIPQNKVNFYDIICKNVTINYDSKTIITTIALQIEEQLIDGKLEFNYHLVAIDDLQNYFGHIEIDAENELVINENGSFEPKINEIANFSIGNKIKFINGKIIKNE